MSSPHVHQRARRGVTRRVHTGGVDHTAHFSLIEDGHGHWIIRHQITDFFAGTILRTANGFRLRNENGRTVGNFPTIEAALEGLYARA